MVGELHQSLKNVAGTSAAEAADVCARTLASLPRGAINMMGPDSARKLLAVCAGGSPLLYERISLVSGVAKCLRRDDTADKVDTVDKVHNVAISSRRMPSRA